MNTANQVAVAIGNNYGISKTTAQRIVRKLIALPGVQTVKLGRQVRHYFDEDLYKTIMEEIAPRVASGIPVEAVIQGLKDNELQERFLLWKNTPADIARRAEIFAILDQEVNTDTAKVVEIKNYDDRAIVTYSIESSLFVHALPCHFEVQNGVGKCLKMVYDNFDYQLHFALLEEDVDSTHEDVTTFLNEKLGAKAVSAVNNQKKD